MAATALACARRYAGFKLTRDRKAGTIQLTMPQKVTEAAREHLPELLSGEPPSTPLPKGKALRDMADRLALPAVRTAASLVRKQRRTQQLIGSLKFIERLHPRLSRSSSTGCPAS